MRTVPFPRSQQPFFFYKDRLYRVDLEAGGPKIAAGCNRSSFSFSSQSLQAAFRRLALLLARLTDIGNPAHTQRARRQELRAWLQCCARMLVQIALLVDRFVDTVEIAVFFPLCSSVPSASQDNIGGLCENASASALFGVIVLPSRRRENFLLEP